MYRLGLRRFLGVYELRLALPEGDCWGNEGGGIPRELGARAGNRQAELGGAAKAVPYPNRGGLTMRFSKCIDPSLSSVLLRKTGPTLRMTANVRRSS